MIVYRYDRFARSLKQLVDALGEFSALGIQFISIHKGVDTTTPNGRLIFGIFASIAEFERELIRERVLSGLAEVRNKGKRLGRPAVHREHDNDAGAIRKMRDNGDSYEEIASELGRSKSDAYRVCQTLGCMSAS